MGAPVYHRSRYNTLIKKWAKVALLQRDAIPETDNHIEDLLEELYTLKKQLNTKTFLQERHLAALSHELRTPLQVIKGVGAILSDEVSNGYHQDQLSLMNSAIGLMERLVDDMYDQVVSQSSKIKIKNEIVNIYDLIEEVRLMYYDRCKKKGVSLEIQTSPTMDRIVSIDKKLVMQVLLNVIGNAVKFTHKGEINV